MAIKVKTCTIKETSRGRFMVLVDRPRTFLDRPAAVAWAKRNGYRVVR